MAVETNAQRTLRRRIEDLPPLLTKMAHKSETERQASANAKAARAARAAQHPEFATANLRDDVGFLFTLMMLVAAGASDVMTLHPFSEYLASFLLIGNWWATLTLRIAMPVLVLAAEIFVSHQRVQAREFGRVSRVMWNIAAGAIVVVMPVLALVAQLADPGPDDMIFRLRATALVGITFLIHSFVVFGGRPLIEAKGWLFFRIGDWWLSRTERRDGLPGQRRVGDLYSSYSTNLDAYRSAYPNAQLHPFVFDHVSRTVLERAFGYVVVPAPAQTTASGQTASHRSAQPNGRTNGQTTPVAG